MGGRGRGLRRAPWLVVAALAAGVGTVAAQEAREPSLELGVGLGWGLLVGRDTDFLDAGLGLHLTVGVPVAGPLGLAVDAAWLPLEEDRDQTTGARADNALLSLSAGPTLGVDLGPVRPWVGAFGGVAVGRWTTEAALGSEDGSRTAFAWGGAGGLRVRLMGGDHPVALGAEARLTDTGDLDFARAPALSMPSAPTGLVEEDAVMLSLRLGLRVGL